MASISSTVSLGFGSVGSVALTVTIGFGNAIPPVAAIGSIAVDVVTCVQSVACDGYQVPTLIMDDYSLATDGVEVESVEVL